MNIFKLLLAISAGTVLFTSSTSAQEITGVTIEDVTSELGSPWDRKAIYTIDGAGLNPDNSHSNGLELVHWLSTGTLQSPNDPLPAVITYDLGDNYDLDSIRVWNYNEVNLTNRGANQVEIEVSSSELGGFSSLGTFTFTEAPGTVASDYSQTIDVTSFAAADNTRLVRFNINSNYGASAQLVGLSEVRFNGTTAIPEPGTLTLLALGAFAVLTIRRNTLAFF